MISKIILFTILTLVGCSPSKVEITGEDTQSTKEENPSDIHGGSPAIVTWTEGGQLPGQHACDFSFQDQFGDTFTLYDNFNKVIVLDFSTMWCGVCQIMASDVQAYQDRYGPEGFLWVTILVDNSYGEQPTHEDINEWADMYGITTSPVLAGDRSIIDQSGVTGYPISAWPTVVVLDKDLKIHNGVVGWSESIVLGWVESLL